MKVSPVAASTPAAVNPNEGQSAGEDRRARAKAVAAGSDPVADRGPAPDIQVERAQNSIKKIKMRTQRSPDLHMRVEEPVATPEAPKENIVATQADDKTDLVEQAKPTSEDTKPLSPQFAALAKQKREIQLERQKLDAEKAALAAQANGSKSLEEYRARIKANALNVLLEEGVTYDQLTEQILASNQENANLSAVEARIKAVEERFETQTKTLTEREAAVENQVKAQIRRDIEALISQGPEYRATREAGYAPKVVELIDRTYKKTGELLDTDVAAGLIEKELRIEAARWAKILEVQGDTPPNKQSQPVQQDRSNTKVMRTLTNRDGTTSTTMDKRSRAIAAMEGRLK